MATLNPPESVEANPLAMVVLSGEQLWPNIHGLLHWSQAMGSIREVFVYHALDGVGGRGSAQRLQRFIERCYAGTRVVLHAGSPEASPQDVRNAVKAWMTENPGRRWLLNASGGMKSTAWGLTEFAGTPEVQVVYRDDSHEWFEWERAADTGELGVRKIEGIDPREMDALPVADLVWSQLGNAADTFEVAFESVDSLPVKRLTQEGIVQGWNWPATFSASGLKNDAPGGVLFEHYVGACLREMGVGNLVRRLRLASQRDRKEKLELDLAVNHDGKIAVLDLELRDENGEQHDSSETMASWLRQTIDTRQRLNGLPVQMVLVRPCRLFTEAERALAKGCNIEVIDQREAPRIFSRLAALLKISDLPSEIAEVEAMLVEQVARRGRLLVFGREDNRIRQQMADSRTPEWVDIEAYLNRIRVERGQNWIMWATRTEIIIQLERPANPPAELPSLIQTALGRFGRVRVEATQNGYEAIFVRDNNRLANLRQALAGFVNRRLETMVFVQVRSLSSTPPPVTLRGPDRAVRAPAPHPAVPLQDGGSLGDLESAVDQAFQPKPPRKN